MNKVFSRFKLLIKKMLSVFPSDLPVGMTAFNKWMDEVLELTGPIADKTSMTWLVSNEIMHVKSGMDRVPKRYFVKVLRKFAANQLAAAKVNEIKLQQEAAQKAAQQTVAADTTQPEKTQTEDDKV
jgi:hypothetical protein